MCNTLLLIFSVSFTEDLDFTVHKQTPNVFKSKLSKCIKQNLECVINKLSKSEVYMVRSTRYVYVYKYLQINTGRRLSYL